MFIGVLCGGPGRSPTCDLRVRSALLYATELPGHVMMRESAIGHEDRMQDTRGSVPDVEVEELRAHSIH
jgi:hypothetical protein